MDSSYNRAMKLITAKVMDGQVALPPGTADDGAIVTLLIPEPHQESFELNDSERVFLLESIKQAERGEVVDGWDLLEDIRSA